ncbi:hypothetical protein [Herbidospora mongoliensis]|uniref:hypothetical protein n=1 Tax=Herbidospora mongoliensis TaxID=688067 RepID=UPI00082A6913|nr:hypothetical protein [Herbidospora mongoliensis]
MAGTDDFRSAIPVGVYDTGDLTCRALAGPRVPAPRPDGREAAQAAKTWLSEGWEPRRDVRAVERLPDGRILATLDGVLLEAWLPSSEREWSAADERGGREIVVAGATAWVSAVRPERGDHPSVVQLSLVDGAQVDQITLCVPVSFVRTAHGSHRRRAGTPAHRHGRRTRRGLLSRSRAAPR